MMGIFYKTVFDISCFYAFASFFFCYAVGYETNALSYGVFLVAALVLSISGNLKQHSKTVATIAAVIPVANLFIETTNVGRVEVILVWAYLIFSIYQESYLIYYYHFLDKFKGFLWALIAPVVFALFDIDKGISAVTMAIPYLIIFLAAGVLTLQAARHRATAESRKQFEKYQIFQTIGFFVVCMLLTATNILDTLYYRVLMPAINFLITGFMRLLGTALSMVPNVHIDLKPEIKEFQEAKSQEESAEIVVVGNEWAEMINEITKDQEPKDNTPLLIVLGVILAVILLIVLMNKAAKHSRVVALDVEREDLPEEEQPQKKVKKSLWHPEASTRYYYREFMKKAETTEHELIKSDTTAEIKDKYNTKVSAKPEAAEKITEIYRKVRYSGETATREDAAAIRNLVKKLR